MFTPRTIQALVISNPLLVFKELAFIIFAHIWLWSSKYRLLLVYRLYEIMIPSTVCENNRWKGILFQCLTHKPRFLSRRKTDYRPIHVINVIPRSWKMCLKFIIKFFWKPDGAWNFLSIWHFKICMDFQAAFFIVLFEKQKQYLVLYTVCIWLCSDYFIKGRN